MLPSVSNKIMKYGIPANQYGIYIYIYIYIYIIYMLPSVSNKIIKYGIPANWYIGIGRLAVHDHSFILMIPSLPQKYLPHTMITSVFQTLAVFSVYLSYNL